MSCLRIGVEDADATPTKKKKLQASPQKGRKATPPHTESTASAITNNPSNATLEQMTPALKRPQTSAKIAPDGTRPPARKRDHKNEIIEHVPAGETALARYTQVTEMVRAKAVSVRSILLMFVVVQLLL